MEIKENVIEQKNIDNFSEKRRQLTEKFKEMKILEVMELPLSILNPTTNDDDTASYSKGEPLLVYQKPASDKIWIRDGHHEYYEERFKAGINTSEPDYNSVFLKVQKVNYDPNRDW